MRFALTLSALAVLGTAIGLSWPIHHHCNIEVIDDVGDLYIAGRGDDCSSAWVGAVVPPNAIQINEVKY